MKFIPFALAATMTYGAPIDGKQQIPSEVKSYIEELVKEDGNNSTYTFPCENVLIKMVSDEKTGHALARYVDPSKLTPLRRRMGEYNTKAELGLGRPEELLQERNGLTAEVDAIFVGGADYIYKNSGPLIDVEKDDIAYDLRNGKKIEPENFNNYLKSIGFCKETNKTHSQSDKK